MATNTFEYAREARQNPYIGIMSFQHFRGEKMYSDIVVRPENNRTETERVECYPVSADAEENGRGEGYYPDTSLVYIRTLWKEFEPKRGEYNYAFIENILDEAKAHGQKLIFRLMAHSTRACDDVPEWLKSIVECPERPDGLRVKDSPTDPRFVEYFLDAIRALGERFDSDPTLYAIDISLPGAWGEGHNLELYPDDIIMSIADTYISVFKNTVLFTQAARPELIKYGNKFTTVGWRGDGFGHPYITNEKYPQTVAAIDDVWKVAPVSFESYWWLCEWKRQGWDIDSIIERTLDWHISSFNPKSMPIPHEWKDSIDYWVSRMGYHFTPRSISYPDRISGEATIKLTVENVGVAPIYKDVTLKIRLVGEREYVFNTDVNVKSWLPGVNENEISLSVTENIPSGEYTLEIGIFDGDSALCLATNAAADGDFYKMGTVNIGG